MSNDDHRSSSITHRTLTSTEAEFVVLWLALGYRFCTIARGMAMDPSLFRYYAIKKTKAHLRNDQRSVFALRKDAGPSA